MTVRLRLALTVFLAGALTVVGVLAAVAYAFMRFERERSYDRANAFLERVVSAQADLIEQHRRSPDEFAGWMRSLLLFEPDCQLYLLAGDGTVLATSGSKPLAPGFKVALGPVRQAAAAARGERMPYVMGDDPEHMNLDAVISARALTPPSIAPQAEPVGYLYLVSQMPGNPGERRALFRSALVGPAMALVCGVIALTTVLSAWLVTTVTRPLAAISAEVDAAARAGFDAQATAALQAPAGARAPARDDEFGALHRGFHQLMATLRAQWDRLRELDHFRREGVSNFSHDLRSPLTAAAASLETLQQRWAGDAARAADAQLVEVALRNTHNAAALVRSLSDLAVLDEPQFRLQPVLLDLSEVLDDIVMRFAGRAAAQGVALRHEPQGGAAPHAAVDIELFERALANLVDNALKHTPGGGRVDIRSAVHERRVEVVVLDSGRGIAAADLPRLFDRLYQGHLEGDTTTTTAPATSDEGKGLGLAIVKRIAELHGGGVRVASVAGQGTEVTLWLPLAG